MGIVNKRKSNKISKSHIEQKPCKAKELTNTISFKYITDIEDYSVYAFKTCNSKVYSAFLDELRIITTLTWDEFWKRSRKSGQEKIYADDFKDQKFINSLQIEKGTALYSIRFNGQNSRIIVRRGTKCGRVLFLLGIDINLKMYDH